MLDILAEDDLEVAGTAGHRRARPARSVHNLLHPRSIAVIGASTDPTKIGHLVLANHVVLARELQPRSQTLSTGRGETRSDQFAGLASESEHRSRGPVPRVR